MTSHFTGGHHEPVIVWLCNRCQDHPPLWYRCHLLSRRLNWEKVTYVGTRTAHDATPLCITSRYASEYNSKAEKLAALCVQAVCILLSSILICYTEVCSLYWSMLSLGC